jgi:flagellar hook-associated protein 3 FlgL
MVSSSFRVSQQAIANNAVISLQADLAAITNTNAQISANKRILKPSDDPIGTGSSLQYQADLNRNTQLGKNINDATGWLSTADSTLQSVVQQVQHIRDLAVQAQNGTLGPTELAALGTEIDNTRQTLLALANTKYGTRSIFAGTSAGPAYDATGNYIGRSAAVERTIAPGVRVQVNVNGDDVFGPAGNDLFSLVQTVANDVRGGNAANISTDISNLDTNLQNVQTRQGEVGARSERVDTMKNTNATTATNLSSNLSSVQDVDMSKAIMDLQTQQFTYQAALSTTAKIVQLSLVDFLQ